MLESHIRPFYQRYLVNEVALRIPEWLTANHITALAGAVGLMIVPALAFNLPLLATVLLLISGYLDTLDGTIARLYGQISRVGAALDVTMDRLVEIAVIIGLFSVDPGNRAWEALLMMGSILICITGFLAVAIFTPNTSEKSFHHSPGIVERAELFLFFIVMIWLPDYYVLLSTVFTISVLITGALRLYQFWRQETGLNAATSTKSAIEKSLQII